MELEHTSRVFFVLAMPSPLRTVAPYQSDVRSCRGDGDRPSMAETCRMKENVVKQQQAKGDEDARRAQKQKEERDARDVGWAQK